MLCGSESQLSESATVEQEEPAAALEWEQITCPRNNIEIISIFMANF